MMPLYQFRRIQSSTKIYTFLFVFCLLSPFLSSATDISWTGTTDSLWHNADNWSPAQVPTVGDVVSIDSGSVFINNVIDASCYSLALESFTSLTIVKGSRLVINGDKLEHGIYSSGKITNLGSILIQKVQEAITNRDTIINYGTIQILNIGDDGIYNNGSSVEFKNFGTIEIDTCYRGIYNLGRFVNGGTISVDHADDYGFRNSGDLENLACADIWIDGGYKTSSSANTENRGAFRWRGEASYLSSSSYFLNRGTIEDHGGTDSLDFTYISNSGLIVSELTKEVSIGDDVTDLFINSIFYSFSDSLYIDSDLIISAGVYNRFSNTWTIDDTAEGYDEFFFQGESFSPSCTDTFSIKSSNAILACIGTNTFLGTTSNDWMDASNWDLGHVPMYCENVLVKDVSVEILSGNAACKSLLMYGEDDSLLIASDVSLSIRYGDFGIDMGVSNLLINNGSIEIRDVGGKGIYGQDSAYIYNEGSIEIVDAAEYGIYLNDGHLLNDGLIELSIIKGSGIYIDGGSLENSDSILISDVEEGGFQAENLDSAVNSGYFSIEDAAEFGWSLDQSICYNSGTLEIKSVGEFGLANTDSFYNYSQLLISDVAGFGIMNLGYFNNEGEISIDACEYSAAINGSAGLFSFKESITKDYREPDSYFLNQGLIFIDSSNDSGLQNYDSFVNDTCATIEGYASFYNEDKFINNGYFLLNSQDTLVDAGTFLNYGILVDQFGSFADCISSSSGCYISTGLRLGGTTIDSIYSDLPVEDILLEESSTLTVNSTWYTDDLLLSEGGSFVQSDNEWTPSRSAIQHDMIYFQVESLGGYCYDTVSINLEIAVLAPECDSINWQGSISNVWLLPNNWDLKRAPSTCDDVVVDSLFTLLIPSGDTAVCNTLIIQPNSTLTIPEGALISVQE